MWAVSGRSHPRKPQTTCQTVSDWSEHYHVALDVASNLQCVLPRSYTFVMEPDGHEVLCSGSAFGFLFCGVCCVTGYLPFVWLVVVSVCLLVGCCVAQGTTCDRCVCSRNSFSCQLCEVHRCSSGVFESVKQSCSPAFITTHWSQSMLITHSITLCLFLFYVALTISAECTVWPFCTALAQSLHMRICLGSLLCFQVHFVQLSCLFDWRS